MELLDWIPPTPCCLSIIIFRLDASLHVEIWWMPQATARFQRYAKLYTRTWNLSPKIWAQFNPSLPRTFTTRSYKTWAQFNTYLAPTLQPDTTKHELSLTCAWPTTITTRHYKTWAQFNSSLHSNNYSQTLQNMSSLGQQQSQPGTTKQGPWMRRITGVVVWGDPFANAILHGLYERFVRINYRRVYVKS